jgi:hypothetical protein
MADEYRSDDIPGPWWSRPVRLIRWLLGACTLVGGLTWILINLGGTHAALDLAVGTVLALGALVLLMPHRIQLPRLATLAAVVGIGLAGTAAGLAAKTAASGGGFVYVVGRGWPFHWASRGAFADDPETAYRLAQSANWEVDLVSLSANLLLWAYVGMLLVVIAVLVRRARSARDATGADSAR